MEVIRKRLFEGELYNPRITYDEMDDRIYYTPPGGSTPIPAPEFDPRHTGVIPLEPSGSLACDSAATMTAMLKMLVDAMITQLYDGRDATLLVTGILALLFAFGWVSLFIAIITALVAAALEAGAESLETAFGGTTWDTLTCIFWCHIDADGSLSADGLAGVRTDVNDQIGGIASIILNYYFDTLGEAGLSNASIVMGGLVTGACDDCSCGWCFVSSFIGCPDYDWDYVAGGCSPTEGAATVFGGVASELLVRHITGQAIDHVEVTVTVASGTPSFVAYGWYDPGDNSYHILQNWGWSGAGTYTWDDPSPTAHPYCYIYLSIPGVGSAAIPVMQFSSETGSNPFGDNNC